MRCGLATTSSSTPTAMVTSISTSTTCRAVGPRKSPATRPWDVRWPSSDNENQIVYELNGELQVLDARTKKSTPISINVPDEGNARRPSRVSASSLIESVGLSPKGERALFAARGDVFTAPIEKGPTRNLTESSGAHDKWPSWSPDGSQIAFVSDKSGEEEIYLVPQDGSKPAEQITNGGSAMRYGPEWAHDGKRIAFSDKDGKLYVLTLADRKLVEVADSPRGQIRDYIWSPRGNFLAFTMANPDNQFASVFIWSANDGQAPARHRRQLQLLQSRLGSTGQLSLLPQRSGVCTAAFKCRIQLRHQPADVHLRAGVA